MNYTETSNGSIDTKISKIEMCGFSTSKIVLSIREFTCNEFLTFSLWWHYRQWRSNPHMVELISPYIKPNNWKLKKIFSVEFITVQFLQEKKIKVQLQQPFHFNRIDLNKKEINLKWKKDGLHNIFDNSIYRQWHV